MSEILTAPVEEIALDFAVRIDGTDCRVLRMRRPKVRDTLVLSKSFKPSEMEAAEVRLFANLCEVPDQVIQDMDLYDYKKLQRMYQRMTGQEEKKEAGESAAA